ncbi:hypothetical protein Ddc_15128 [Ditylenchus destructor]|nr:hypothetical protein Ddc_15128 [Ditylenchus destructor]
MPHGEQPKKAKVISPIAQYCKKLEHISISGSCLDAISPEKHANLLRLITLPNLCSLEIGASSCSKEQTTELVNRLIANGKLQYIIMKAMLEPEILLEMLRRCKSIRSISLDFLEMDFDFYSKICQVIDKIDQEYRQQREFTGETHPIGEVQYNHRTTENFLESYKWLRFNTEFLPSPSAM